jgi:hypothetical protein
MATVVTVHGTFAHAGGTADALGLDPARELYWSEGKSGFEGHMRELVASEDGRLEFMPFVWSAANSELARREAGSGLLTLLRGLEARNESYCLVGHSHGGSVISSALLESVAHGKPLDGLKKWITIGTPFVALRKERFLFSRLTLPRKVVFVASIMLLIMFLFYVAGELFDGRTRPWTQYRLTGLLFSGAMMSIPFIVFYIAFWYLDGREHFAYGRRTLKRALGSYGKKWLSLCHEDDEAVHGLKYLPRVNLHFFDREFAVSALTMASIFFLPLAYLFVVTSPSIMVGIAEFLKRNVYDVTQYAKLEAPVAAARQDMRRRWEEIRAAREEAERSGLDPAQAESARQRAETLRREMRETRSKLEAAFPEFAGAERALRFKRRFLEEDGKPCNGGTLCGGGHNYALNSKLLFHVVTDELSAAVVNDEISTGVLGGALRLLVPIVLVPVVFATLSLAILAVIQFVARRVSSTSSRWLNRLTLSEIKRSAFGNDTEGEIALGADHCPTWIETKHCHLPGELGDKIADYTNQVTAQSLAKFRNAISTLAFSEGEDKGGLISAYLTWKELIHATYFEVPEFRKLVAHAVSRAEGFKATESFKADPDYERAGRWLDAVEGRTEPAAAKPLAA